MRTKLSEKYVNEREDICKKIIEILELNNNTFLLNELDQNIEKRTKLLDLKPELLLSYRIFCKQHRYIL